MARTEPARGTRDFLPEDVRRRDHVIGIVKRVFERYGYEPLETPAFENLETLTGKYGDEGSQLIFKILKRGEHEATGQADLALRYDLTVPLARAVAHHRARLPRLFKRYQIQPVWRADRPARGRFREFYQCDVDALGSTSPVVEAEVCAAVSDVLTELGFQEFAIRLNHRQLLTGILDSAGVERARHGDALIALDKLDKIGAAGVSADLAARGFGQQARDRLLRLFAVDLLADDAGARLETVQRFVAGHADATWALANLRRILDLSRHTSAAGRLRLDPSLARGLSYYTGAIMEISVPDLAGSLGGGGRYDDLIGMFSGESIPACGFSLGLERILVIMTERHMFPPGLPMNPADVMVAAFEEAGMPHAMTLAAALRRSSLRVFVYPEPDKIGKQLKYAESRGIPCVAMLGENEIARHQVTIKHLASRAQETHAQDRAGEAVKELLARG
ncbi:MAG: histidine--tRNA ligase [Vicinamibacterales bacterium]